jgi:2,5-dichloro-2,5-cyclohexadiene-1,4-diol dehydrogenase 1
MKGISDKSIIVTGGSDGIGAATAKLLASLGARVTIADVNESKGTETTQAINSSGGKAQFVRTDIADEASVKAMVAAAVRTYGRLDGAFNNAAIPNTGKRLHEISFAEWQRCQSINLTGTFLCLKYEIEQMLTSGGGAIVNTSSIAGLVYTPMTAEYSSSKHGVSGLTKAAASDYGHDSIRVNAIAPAAVRTAMYARFAETNPQFEAQCAALHPIGRASMPEEQAEAVAWLLSDAASFVTGIIMPVDGGYTAV